MLDRETVSTSQYLYGCETNELCIPEDIQLMFVEMRLHRVEATIGSILRVSLGERDNTRDWCHKMIKEIKE